MFSHILFNLFYSLSIVGFIYAVYKNGLFIPFGGIAYQLLSGNAVAPGATLTALTMAAGDNLQVKQASGDIKLLSVFGQALVPLTMQVRSPRFHDNVNGITITVANDGYKTMDVLGLVPQKLVAQDNLLAFVSGSAVPLAVNNMFMLIYYSNLSGSNGRFSRPTDVLSRALNVLTVPVLLNPTVAGDYSGEVSINSMTDLLKANTDYAIIGYTLDTPCGAIGIRGVDTGNMRIGAPGTLVNPKDTSNHFMDFSRKHGVPAVPIINSANKNNTFIDVVQDDGLASVGVTFIMAELLPPSSLRADNNVQ
jgi:hypothetical protein